MPDNSGLTKYQQGQLQRHPKWKKPWGVAIEWLNVVLAVALGVVAAIHMRSAHAAWQDKGADAMLILLAAALFVGSIAKGLSAVAIYKLHKKAILRQ